VNSKKLIAIDLDGTLFYPKKPISLVIKKNILFIQDAIKAGHEIVFVTSRNHEFVQKVVAKVGSPIDIISKNGSQIVYKNKLIQNTFVDNQIIQSIINEIITKFPTLLISIDTDQHTNLAFTESKQKWLFFIYRLYYLIQGNYREAYTLDNETFKQALSSEKIQRLLIYFGLSKKAKKLAHDESERLMKLYPQVEISWIQSLIEISDKGVNKANAILKILSLNGMKEEDVIVVGDSGNDIPMFKTFEHAYCMSHAHPRVKKYAKYFVNHVYDLRKVLGL